MTLKLLSSGTQDRSIENGAGTAYGLRGLGDWIDSAGPADVPANFRTPASSIYDISTSGAFSELALNNLISSIYRETGNSNNLMLVADTGLRRTIADFARVRLVQLKTVRSVNYDGNRRRSNSLLSSTKVDHGMVSHRQHEPRYCSLYTCWRHYASMIGYLINPEYYGVHELIPMGSTRLPNLGGGERGFVRLHLDSRCIPPQELTVRSLSNYQLTKGNIIIWLN